MSFPFFTSSGISVFFVSGAIVVIALSCYILYMILHICQD
nr:MAG TPA: Rifin [Caudoviricetes sp.]